jgi:phenylglyoxylate dehydrogenase beta subunit
MRSKQLNDTLVVEYGHCPEACSLCELACAEHDNGRASITAVHLPESGFHGVVKCNQCGEPRCLEVCPTGAITRGDANGVVRIAEAKCVGCGLCTLACPYGGIYYDRELGKTYKCDNCDGKPECVAGCSYGILTFARAEPALEYLGEQLSVKGNMNCAGCGIDLSIKIATTFFGENTIFATGPGCSAANLMAVTDGVTLRAPTALCYMTNAPGFMTGVKRYFQHTGEDTSCVIFAGDGMTADVGFQSLSGAAERGENIIYICLDNEAYMNTGIQMSGTTPYLAWTRTTPVGQVIQGKQRQAKNVPLLMVFHGIPYVATACVAYLEDYLQKLARARQVKNGMAYIHVFAPCPTGWRAPTDSPIELGKMAVETNYFPLWEAVDGKFSFTYHPKSPRPITEFTQLAGRFRHLNEEQLGRFQEMVNSRLRLLESLVSAGEPRPC